jgi:hypothetical protein
MTLAADCFRCPGSRCPDFVREGCRRFIDLKVGVGPRTPYADVSLGPVAVPCGDRTLSGVDLSGTWAACPHKWPLVH